MQRLGRSAAVGMAVLVLGQGPVRRAKAEGAGPDLHINPVKDNGHINYFPERKNLKSRKQ